MSRLALVQAAIQQALAVAWPEVTHRIGSGWLANHEDPNPRIVWVPPLPGKERFEAPDYVGQVPQAFRTRVMPVELHCSAATFDDVDQLGHDLSAVLHRLLVGNYELIAAGFASENEAELAQSEHVYVLQVELRFPIVDQLRGQSTELVTVETTQLASKIQLPGGDEDDLVPGP